VSLDARLLVALLSAAGVCLILAGVMRWRRRARMHSRLRVLSAEWAASAPLGQPSSGVSARTLAHRLGARLGARLPGQVGSLAERLDRAGLAGAIQTIELLGWKVVCVGCGVAVGLWAIARYGALGTLVLLTTTLIGWFGIDLVLARHHEERRRQILRDLPTVMDLLVLSLEAGMGLDRALRTVVHEYHSALSDELHRVLNDVDLGMSRGAAFERMAQRVGLEDLRALSRAIVQSEELGVSLVGTMQTQSHEVRLSRRRAAEGEALRAPIKMLFPLVIFILPTLFMLLLGPVGLRTGAALGGVSGP
jgi:tight adherence protein C